MCGIIGYASKNKHAQRDEAKEFVINQYEEQHSRGTRGFGVTLISDTGHVTVKRATEPVKMMVDLNLATARHIILHHRAPTSSDNTLSQTHPIVVENDELECIWYVNHNGVLRNEHELKKAHNELGYVYTTEHEVERYTNSKDTIVKFNDSESFAIELARFFELKSPFISAKGTMAFIAVACHKKTGKVMAIYIGTNDPIGHPMVLDDWKEGFAFASESAGVELKKNECVRMDAKYTQKGQLTGFFTEDEFLTELKFEEEKSVVSPYQPSSYSHGHNYHFNDEDLPPTKWNPPGMTTKPIGFHAEKIPGTDFKRLVKDNEKVKFDTYQEILDFYEKSSLGEVLRLKNCAAEAWQYFDFAPIRNLIQFGQIDKAEDLWNTYLDDMAETLDLGEVLSKAVDHMVQIDSTKTLDEAVKIQLNSVNVRMGIMARELNPLFKIIALMDMIFRTSYALQIRLSAPEQVEAEVVGRDDERESSDAQIAETALAIATAPAPAPAPINTGHYEGTTWVSDKTIHVNADADESIFPDETDGAHMLEILEHIAAELPPEKVLEEAEHVADVLHSEASLEIDNQLGEMVAQAAEMGEPLSLGFYSSKSREAILSAESRFTRLAKVVARAHERDDEEIAMYGGYD